MKRLLFPSFITVLFWSTQSTAELLKMPDLPASQMVQSEVAKIYDPSSTQTIGPLTTIAPWADANALMVALRNKMLSLEVNALNNALYLEGYGKDTPSDVIITTHLTGYCARSSTNEQKLAGGCPSDPLMQNADIKISTILSGFRYDEGGARETAAKMVMNNLIQPIPTPGYLDENNQLVKDALTKPDQRKQLAEALTEQAMLSTARYSLAEMVAKRTSVSTSKGAVSMMEILEKEAAQRFLNTVWQNNMAALKNKALSDNKPEQAVLYEIAMMDAFRNWMEYERYRQTERVEALLAALLSLQYKQVKGGAAALSSVTSSSVDSTPSPETEPGSSEP